MRSFLFILALSIFVAGPNVSAQSNSGQNACDPNDQECLTLAEMGYHYTQPADCADLYAMDLPGANSVLLKGRDSAMIDPNNYNPSDNNTTPTKESAGDKAWDIGGCAINPFCDLVMIVGGTAAAVGAPFEHFAKNHKLARWQIAHILLAVKKDPDTDPLFSTFVSKVKEVVPTTSATDISTVLKAHLAIGDKLCTVRKGFHADEGEATRIYKAKYSVKNAEGLVRFVAREL
jgi:hypothetical protein